MKYTWKIFKYSKICPTNESFISECGIDLLPLSQTILHSEIEGSKLKQERWLHLYTQTNRTLEISIGDCIEIKLFITKENEMKSHILEKIDFKSKMKWSAKGRSFACKIENKRFQISFYDQEEVITFHKLFSEQINFKIEESHSNEMKVEFIRKMKILNQNTIKNNSSERKSYKGFEELKKEFLDLVYFT